MVNAGLACLAHYCRMGGASAVPFPSSFQPCLVRYRPVPYRTVPAIQPDSLTSPLFLRFFSSPSILLLHLLLFFFLILIATLSTSLHLLLLLILFLFLILSPFLLLFLSRAGLVPAPNPTSTIITITRPCVQPE